MYIKPEGSPTAKILLVGESPGRVELTKNRPFVGPAGKLLDRLLRQAGITRSDCYIVNTVGEFVESIDDVISFKKKKEWQQIGKAWVSDKYLENERVLFSLINNSSANVIVPLGKVALYATTGYTDITKRRGSILTSEIFPGKKIIPTIHPAAALHEYLFEYFITQDLRRALDESITPELVLPERTCVIQPSFVQCLEYIERAQQQEYIGFDIECIRVRQIEYFQDWEISCLSIALSAEEVICIPFIDEHGNDYFPVDQEIAIWRELRKLLTNQKVKKIGQNMVFDASFIYRKMGIVINPIEDTMIAAALLYPEFPKGLDFLTSFYTREPYYKDEGKTYIRANSSSEAFWLYNCKDSAVLHEIFPVQKDELEEQGLTHNYNTAVALIPPLIYMQSRGILCNVEARKAASEALQREIEATQVELNRLCGHELNPQSPKQVATYFYIEKSLPPYKNKSGGITADVTALTRLKAKGYKEAELILHIRKLAKLNGTYMEMTLDADNRIRSSFNPVGTKTGRLSSSATIFGTGGNMQNLPSTYKRYMLADPEHIMYEVDLSQAENRIVAYIAPEPKMIDAFETGKDVHSLTGSLISGLPYEVVKEHNKLFEKTKDPQYAAPLGAQDKTWRFWGKTSNHSLNYDIGPIKFALRVEITTAEAKEIKEKYYAVYPGIRQYHLWVQSLLQESRSTTNLLGRKRRYFDRWGEDLFREAYATIPQSSVADIINQRGLVPLYYNTDYRETQLLDQVHDSIIFQIPASIGFQRHAEILLQLKQSLEQPLQWKDSTFVIPADFKMGNCLGTLKDLIVSEDTAVTANKLTEVWDGIKATTA